MWNGAPSLRGNSLCVWPVQTLAMLPGRSKAVQARFFRAHLQTTYPARAQPPSPDKPSTPTGHTQEIKPNPRKTHPRPGRNPPPRPPRTHPQTLANPSDPNQNHPSIAPQRYNARQKGAPSGETTPNPKSGRWRGMESHPPRGSNRRPKTEAARGSKRPC